MLHVQCVSAARVGIAGENRTTGRPLVRHGLQLELSSKAAGRVARAAALRALRLWGDGARRRTAAAASDGAQQSSSEWNGMERQWLEPPPSPRAVSVVGRSRVLRVSNANDGHTTRTRTRTRTRVRLPTLALRADSASRVESRRDASRSLKCSEMQRSATRRICSMRMKELGSRHKCALLAPRVLYNVHVNMCTPIHTHAHTGRLTPPPRLRRRLEL